MKKVPNPGSSKAVEMGCTCAVLDNWRGDPKFGRIHGFYVTEGCPLHWTERPIKTHNLGQVQKTHGIIGLMFKLKPPELLYYIPLPTYDKSLHTWFMFFPIDVIFVNSFGRVVEKTRIYPWNVFIPGTMENPDMGIVAAIEGKVGAFDYIKPGDFVKFVF